jgi:hypothetical protein
MRHLQIKYLEFRIATNSLITLLFFEMSALSNCAADPFVKILFAAVSNPNGFVGASRLRGQQGEQCHLT